MIEHTDKEGTVEVVGLATRTRLWKAVEADPDGYIANRDMGLYCSTRKNYALLAEPYLKKALAHDLNTPERPHLLFRLAQIHKMKGEFQDAWNILADLVNWAPEEIAFELGDLSYFKGDFDLASGMFRSALDMMAVRARALAAEKGEPDVRQLVPNKVVCTHIGETIHKLDLFVKAKKLGLIEDFRAILMAPSEFVINRFLLEAWSDHIDIVTDPDKVRAESERLSERRFNLDFMTLPDGRTVNRDLAYWWVQQRWQAEGRPPLLVLTEAQRGRGRKALSKLGLPEDVWFACLHVREGGYHSEQVAWSHNRLRNGKLVDYMPAVREITRRGGWVVRIGDSTMTALPDMPNVIDYARCDAQEDWLDIFCIAGARLFFGTTSGPLMVAGAYDVPIALSNAFPLWNWPHAGTVVLAHKLLREKRTGRLIPLAEALDNPTFTQIFPTVFENTGIEVVDNTPEEILGTVTDLLDRLDGTISLSEGDKERQRAFARVVDPMNFGVSINIARNFLNAHPELIGLAGLSYERK